MLIKQTIEKKENFITPQIHVKCTKKGNEENEKSISDLFLCFMESLIFFYLFIWK